jgi:hypothetical protein
MNTNLNPNLPVAAENDLEPRGEVAASIKLFHDAMHSIADRATARPVPSDWLMPARRRQRSAQRRMILAWSCAAALCFAVVPLSIHNAHPVNADHQLTGKVTGAQPAPAQPEVSEDALLEQVDNEISEPVPSSLAPLTELDSWNSTNSESSTHTEKKNVTQ